VLLTIQAEAKAALEAAAAKEREEQIERETYMTMKEAKLAAECEVRRRRAVADRPGQGAEGA
jgi:hypothetical protein